VNKTATNTAQLANYILLHAYSRAGADHKKKLYSLFNELA